MYSLLILLRNQSLSFNRLAFLPEFSSPITEKKEYLIKDLNVFRKLLFSLDQKSVYESLLAIRKITVKMEEKEEEEWGNDKFLSNKKILDDGLLGEICQKLGDNDFYIQFECLWILTNMVCLSSEFLQPLMEKYNFLNLSLCLLESSSDKVRSQVRFFINKIMIVSVFGQYLI
jgi:hypothetical protein